MFALTIFLLLTWLLGSAAWAHDPFVLDSRRAAPGNIQLELVEVPSSSQAASKRYKLFVSGFSPGKLFSLFTRDFSHSFHEVKSGFRLERGDGVSADYGLLNEVLIEPGPYPRGAAWEVALVSSDRLIRSFTKVIPYPITFRAGDCAVWLELVSQRGDRFLASGSGFPSNDDVVIESRFSGRIITKRKEVSFDGTLPQDDVLLGGTSTDYSAQYTVKAKSCEVMVNYKWGEAALTRYQ